MLCNGANNIDIYSMLRTNEGVDKKIVEYTTEFLIFYY